MKKLLLLTAIALITVAGVTAQERKNAIKANPLALLGGADLISYERALGENSTVSIGGGVGGFKIGGVKYKSSGASLQYRYYFNEAINGWYLGAIAQYQGGKVETNANDILNGFTTLENNVTDEIKFSSFGGGAKAGYQWAFGSGFTLDLNLGASYSSFSYDDDNDNVISLKGNGVLPTFGFGLGYSW